MIITLIISSVIILIIKKDAKIDSFYIVNKPGGVLANPNSGKASILKQDDDMDISFVFNLKNPHKDEKYRLAVFLENGSFQKILQTDIVRVEKEIPQLVEVSFVGRGKTYEQGRYLVKLFCNEKLVKKLRFEIR